MTTFKQLEYRNKAEYGEPIDIKADAIERLTELSQRYYDGHLRIYREIDWLRGSFSSRPFKWAIKVGRIGGSFEVEASTWHRAVEKALAENPRVDKVDKKDEE